MTKEGKGMHHFVRLTDFCHDDVMRIFRTADEIKQGMHTGILKGKSIVLFFPASSIRTRVTFEKGIYLLTGGFLRNNLYSNKQTSIRRIITDARLLMW